MRKTFLFIIPILIILFIVSCKDNSTQSSPSLEIYPMKIGNRWDYSVTANHQTSLHFDQVIKDTTVNNEQWFIMTYDSTDYMLCKNKTDGLWFTYIKSPMTPPVLTYKYPGFAGDSYTAGENAAVTIDSINATVAIPPLNFTCYKYHVVYNDSLSTDEYYSPGVGLVKIIYYTTHNGLTVASKVTLLVSYTLK
jgi:hypothetical protein